MSSRPALAALLFEDAASPPRSWLRNRRRLVRRLLLAELVAPPPALREPGARTPLSPRADERD